MTWLSATSGLAGTSAWSTLSASPGRARSPRSGNLASSCGGPGQSTEGRLNKILRPTQESFFQVREFPYPVCLLYFAMEDNQGYYTWIVEPVLTEDGKPQLQM